MTGNTRQIELAGRARGIIIFAGLKGGDSACGKLDHVSRDVVFHIFELPGIDQRHLASRKTFPSLPICLYQLFPAFAFLRPYPSHRLPFSSLPWTKTTFPFSSAFPFPSAATLFSLFLPPSSKTLLSGRFHFNPLLFTNRPHDSPLSSFIFLLALFLPPFPPTLSNSSQALHFTIFLYLRAPFPSLPIRQQTQHHEALLMPFYSLALLFPTSLFSFSKPFPSPWIYHT